MLVSFINGFECFIIIEMQSVLFIVMQTAINAQIAFLQGFDYK